MIGVGGDHERGTTAPEALSCPPGYTLRLIKKEQGSVAQVGQSRVWFVCGEVELWSVREARGERAHVRALATTTAAHELHNTPRGVRLDRPVNRVFKRADVFGYKQRGCFVCGWLSEGISAQVEVSMGQLHRVCFAEVNE